jgi:hypothetical protein
MSGFFQQPKSKCGHCRLNTVKNRQNTAYKLTSPVVETVGSGKDLLILFESFPSSFEFEIFKNYVKRYNFKNYTFGVAIECVLTLKSEFPDSPDDIYTSCNTFPNIDQYKTILAIGQSVYGIIKNSDLTYYYDFSETEFNQTYFYQNIKSSLRRVYPLPPIQDFIGSKKFDIFWEYSKPFMVDDDFKKIVEKLEKERPKSS